MTLFNADPYGIDDIDTLRGMVDLLQKANNNLSQMQEISKNLQDVLYRANIEQGEQIALLNARIEILQQGVINNRPEQPLRAN